MTKRNIIKLNGGLGNQMFQWAFAKALEHKTGVKSYLDMSFFNKKYSRPYELNLFTLEASFINNFWDKLKIDFIWKFRKKLNKRFFWGLRLYSEPHFEYDENVFDIGAGNYVEGFFQSEKYFLDISKELKNDFTFKNQPDEINKKIIDKMHAENSVSLHIRRGDYVQKKRYQNVYANCSLDYYKKGVELIAQKYDDLSLYIFSDDIEWVKTNLKLDYESNYISHNSGNKSFEDMRLMSNCKHNVIANSSFSWWGAWLNNNPDKIVIAPKKWFNDQKIIQTDIIPSAWTKLEN